MRQGVGLMYSFWMTGCTSIRSYEILKGLWWRYRKMPRIAVSFTHSYHATTSLTLLRYRHHRTILCRHKTHTNGSSHPADSLFTYGPTAIILHPYFPSTPPPPLPWILVTTLVGNHQHHSTML